MKDLIWWFRSLLSFALFLMLLFIIGGVESGYPLYHLIYCIPIIILGIIIFPKDF